MYTGLLNLDALSELEKLPKRYKDYAFASLALAAARLGLDYNSFLAEVENLYLKLYVEAELPLYDPEYYEKALREVVSNVTWLKYLERVYVLGRLSETAFQLDKGDYKYLLEMASNYLPPLGYSGRARFSLALARCGELSRAKELVSAYSVSRRVSFLVEATLSRPQDFQLLSETMQLIRKIRSGRRRMVLLSRLAKHPLYFQLRAPKPQELALKLPLGETLRDMYVSLLVSRNLGEIGLAKEFRDRFELILKQVPSTDLLPVEASELLVEVAYHARGIEGSVKLASQSKFYPLLVAHLAEYITKLSLEQSILKEGQATNNLNN